MEGCDRPGLVGAAAGRLAPRRRPRSRRAFPRGRAVEGGDSGTAQGALVRGVHGVLHDRSRGHDLLHHPQPQDARLPQGRGNGDDEPGGERPVLVRGYGGGGLVPLHVRGHPGGLLRSELEKGALPIADGCGSRVHHGPVLRGLGVHGALREEDAVVQLERLDSPPGEWEGGRVSHRALSVHSSCGTAFFFFCKCFFYVFSLLHLS
ncbi:unnamed protein product [Ectocarpus fasciculatus]